jgi:hypothetical protein
LCRSLFYLGCFVPPYFVGATALYVAAICAFGTKGAAWDTPYARSALVVKIRLGSRDFIYLLPRSVDRIGKRIEHVIKILRPFVFVVKEALGFFKCHF